MCENRLRIIEYCRSDWNQFCGNEMRKDAMSRSGPCIALYRLCRIVNEAIAYPILIMFALMQINRRMVEIR